MESIRGGFAATQTMEKEEKEVEEVKAKCHSRHCRCRCCCRDTTKVSLTREAMARGGFW